ncbi:TPA: hypothetical protein HA278_05195, partial [Candidatus Woesearchaeota archaeon]|nr:hypothetical protein [Candidatus Woesearchaeota archaeon]
MEHNQSNQSYSSQQPEIKVVQQPEVQQRPAAPRPAQPANNVQAVSPSKVNHDVDAELKELIAAHKTRIKVIGCGGAGNNTINRMTEVGIKGIQTIAINTDAQDLLYTSCDKKLLIGKELTSGLGAGSNPKIGEGSAKENEHDLKKLIEGADLIFITCGLGGGTGTGSAPYISHLAKKMGILSVGIVT